MAATLATSALSLPDPPQDCPVPNAVAPSRFGGLLGLVRRLFDYGKGLARTVQQPAAASDLDLRIGFGTSNVALMLARVTRGLMLLSALEDRLVRLVERTQRQPQAAGVPPAPVAPPAPVPEAPPRKPRAGQPAVARRRLEDPASLLVRMPTMEEITAFVRRRPIGAIIADICSDLGIMMIHPQWDELKDAVVSYGGSFIRLIRDVFGRGSLLHHFPPDTPIPPAVLEAWRSGDLAYGTGPP